MEWVNIVCLAVGVIVLMFVAYLVVQLDLVLAILGSISKKLDMEPPEPMSAMDLMLLKANKQHKTKRFTDKSRDWLAAHEKESRR